MVTIVILFILFVACCFALLNWRKTTAAVIVVALIGFEAVGCGLVPSLLLKNLQLRSVVENNSQRGKRNAIIVLGGGTA